MEFGIKDGWHEQRSEADGFGIRIRSLVFDRNKQCAGFSVIRMRLADQLAAEVGWLVAVATCLA
jgi:hypothetical protein